MIKNDKFPWAHRAYFTCYSNARPFLDGLCAHPRYKINYQGFSANGYYTVYWS